MKYFLRGVIIFISFIVLWELIARIFHLPAYILPTPFQVFLSGYKNFNLIALESIPTLIETLLGLGFGILLGCCVAIFMAFFQPVRMWLSPVLIVSQALPTFVIAPLFVIWFGFGMASKIITTILTLFYPVTSAFYDGLRRTHSGWLDLAKNMQASKWKTLLHIRIPAALPSLASGIRVATVIAPIGAIIGEWVGASHGLGYLMLNANARMEIDLMFAALFMIVIFSLGLYFLVDMILKKIIFWQAEV